MRGWCRQHQTGGDGHLGRVYTLAQDWGASWRHTGNGTYVEIHIEIHKSRETYGGMYRGHTDLSIYTDTNKPRVILMDIHAYMHMNMPPHTHTQKHHTDTQRPRRIWSLFCLKDFQMNHPHSFLHSPFIKSLVCSNKVMV